MKTQTEQAAHALSTWNRARNPNPDARFALYGPSGQYHGAFKSESAAHAYVDSVSDTEAWIGEGYAVVRFR